ncbi:MAG: hypothetical protein Q8S11_00630 [Daejeonella sp.]|uniref:hypothetical protein n=1 Tax=Daejeonella sp. TaxID=2805397 RepID=UPI002732435F|nr:hypothetical protein [Daejeonella sp.]MDP3466807.1 hypothetical protein [Daejeonella sp.]
MDGVDNIIKEFVKYGGIYPFNKSDVFDVADVNRLKSEGIIEHQKRTTWRLTKKGWQIVESGKSWREWQDHSSITSIHIGHNISNSTMNHSDLSTNALNSPITMPASIQSKQSIMVGILKLISENIVKVIIGVVVGLLAIYFGITSV